MQWSAARECLTEGDYGSRRFRVGTKLLLFLDGSFSFKLSTKYPNMKHRIEGPDLWDRSSSTYTRKWDQGEKRLTGFLCDLDAHTSTRIMWCQVSSRWLEQKRDLHFRMTIDKAHLIDFMRRPAICLSVGFVSQWEGQGGLFPFKIFKMNSVFF